LPLAETELILIPGKSIGCTNRVKENQLYSFFFVNLHNWK